MRFSSPALLVALLGIGAAPLAAQIPTGSRGATVVNNAPRLFVATPFVPASADSSPAVEVGVGLRERMERVVGRNFRVVARDQMNTALATFGYPADAILMPSVARQLALQMQSRTAVYTTLRHAAGEPFTATTRFVGLFDDAGYVVQQSQRPGQSNQEFGQGIADALEPAVRSIDDARECVNLSETEPQKAAGKAQDAIKRLPASGLAHLCLAELALKRNAPATEVVPHLEQATQGDPQSLKAWTLLAQQHEQQGDSAAVIQDFRQMLLAAPTNEELRKRAFQLFLQYGRAETALEVAEEGLALDPANPDLYDLKSNACIFLGDYACAVDALEQVIVNDPTKADTLFYAKITATAAAKPDTARLLRWATEGLAKYPDNASLLDQATTAYRLSGNLDSAMAVGTRLMQVDTGASSTLLALSKDLVEGGRPGEAMPYIDYVAQHGDDSDKQNASAILTQGGLALLQQQPMDAANAYVALKRAVEVAPAGSQVLPTANYLYGLAAFQYGASLDEAANAAKSCEQARQMQGLFQEARIGLTAGQQAQPEQAAQFLGYVTQYEPRAASMITAYCR